MALNEQQLKNIHIMQRICVVPAGRRYGESGEPEITKVSKVGTKYFHTADGRKWELESGRQVTDFTGAELFISEKEYATQKEIKENWKITYSQLSQIPPKGITLEQIFQIRDIANLDV